MDAAQRERLREWFIGDRAHPWWMFWLFIAALLIRVHWNLEVHPIGEFNYSDMKGYNNRANAVLSKPFQAKEYAAFFPFGATWMLAGVKAVFGTENFAAIGTYYALLGAGVVVLVYAITARVCPAPWAAPAAGLFTTLYYPLIAIGSYTLSELPFAFFIALSLLFTLRFVDGGRTRDAWGLGLAVGASCLVRSQFLLTVVLVVAYLLLVRRHLPTPIRLRRVLVIAVPVVAMLTMASARLYHHTGRFGLVSENGPINLVFGRCHNKGIYSRPDGHGHGTVRFAPPPLIQLEAHSKREPDSWIQLRPVWAEHPAPVPGVDGFAIDKYGCRKRNCKLQGAEIEYKGYIGDGPTQLEIVRECIARSGFSGQAYFSFVHVVQLWAFNRMWPDQANPRPRPVEVGERWRALQDRWMGVHLGILLGPALLGLGFVFRPRTRLGPAIVALNLLALLAIAVLFVGGIRFRIPYDPVIIVLAVCTLAAGAEFVRSRIAKAR